MRSADSPLTDLTHPVTATGIAYLQAIHRLQRKHEIVAPSLIAQEIHVSVASATNMCKRLAEQKLVHRTPHVGVSLSQEGHIVVQDVFERRRLVFRFLSQEKTVDPLLIEAEADRLAVVTSKWFCSMLSKAVIVHEGSDCNLTA